MSDFGFDFRNTGPYVTDPPNCQWGGAGNGYPIIAGGVTFGWETGAPSNNYTTGVDPRLAGDCYVGAGSTMTFRVDLPATGLYTVQLALGDNSNAFTGQKVVIQDTTTPLLTVTKAGSLAAQHYLDGSGVERTSAADWATNQASSASLNFTTTICRVVVGNAGDYNSIAHFRIISAASGITIGEMTAAANARPLQPGYSGRYMAGGGQVALPSGGVSPDVTVDKWFSQFSQPLQRRGALRRQVFFAPPKALPAAPNTVDKWLVALSQPLRQMRPLSPQRAFFAPFNQPPEAVTVDKWLAPLSQPLQQREPLSPQRAFFAPVIPTVAPEVVTVDKWLSPLSQPIRQRNPYQAAPIVTDLISPFSPPGCPQGATFDGTDLMLRGGPLTGAADGTTGTFSIWFRKNGGDGASQNFLRNASARVNFFIAPDNRLGFILMNAASTITLRIDSTAAYLAGPTWHHALVSYNTNFAAGSKLIKLAIDGVVDPGTITDAGAAFNVDNTDTDWAVGAAVNGTNKANADFAELWWDDGTYLDLTVPANVQKFIKANGDAQNGLGPDGSDPTGSPPLVYLKGPAATFPMNLGTGGSFTVTGALTDSLTNPPCDTAPEDVTVDKWYVPLSQPLRALRPIPPQRAFFSPVIPTVAPPEVVTLDKWYVPLRQPQRALRPLPAQRAFFAPVIPTVATTEVVTVDKWFVQLSQPQTPVILTVAGGQVALGAQIDTIEDVSVDKWYTPLSQPLRALRPLSPQHAFFAPVIPTVAPPEVVTLDKWFMPLSQPIRENKPYQAAPMVTDLLNLPPPVPPPPPPPPTTTFHSPINSVGNMMNQNS